MRNAGSAGKYNGPGLPNITGGLDGVVMSSGSESGCIAASGGAVAKITGADSNFLHANINIWASYCSVIYGSSTTVMPASVDLVCAIYLGRSA